MLFSKWGLYFYLSFFGFLFAKWVQKAQLYPLLIVRYLCTCKKLKTLVEQLKKNHRANKPKLKLRDSSKFSFDLCFSNCSGTEALMQRLISGRNLVITLKILISILS